MNGSKALTLQKNQPISSSPARPAPSRTAPALAAARPRVRHGAHTTASSAPISSPEARVNVE